MLDSTSAGAAAEGSPRSKRWCCSVPTVTETTIGCDSRGTRIGGLADLAGERFPVEGGDAVAAVDDGTYPEPRPQTAEVDVSHRPAAPTDGQQRVGRTLVSRVAEATGLALFCPKSMRPHFYKDSCMAFGGEFWATDCTHVRNAALPSLMTSPDANTQSYSFPHPWIPVAGRPPSDRGLSATSAAPCPPRSSPQ